MKDVHRKCVVVMGMHRSGTSAASGLLNILGLDLGKTILPIEEDNPKGFFENERITLFNERLLDLLYATWNDTFSLPPDWWEDENIISLQKEIIDIFESEFTDPQNLLIKDPRLSILIPFYQAVFKKLEIHPHYVICLRNPLEVAESLSIRNNFTVQKSLLLWMDYMLNAEIHTRNAERIILGYDDLLKEPLKFVQKLLQKFQIDLTVTDEKRKQIEAFPEPRLKHHNHADMLAEHEIIPEISNYYQLLLNARTHDLDNKNLADIDRIRKNFYAHFSLYNEPGSNYKAKLIVETQDGSRETYNKAFTYGPNELEFDVSRLKQINKLNFRPSNTMMGIEIKDIILSDESQSSSLLNSYKSNAGYEPAKHMLIFETEEPIITISLDKPVNLQKITFILKYLVVGDATYRMSIKERNTALNETLHELKNKETWILKQRETILRKNQQIEKNQQQIEKNQQKVDEQAKIIDNKDQRITEKDKIIASKVEYINERDKIIAKKKETINEKDKIIAEKKETINEKDKIIERKAGYINERDEIIAKKKETINEKDKIIASKAEYINEKDRILIEKEELLDRTFKSYTWKAGKFILSPAHFCYRWIYKPLDKKLRKH